VVTKHYFHSLRYTKTSFRAIMKNFAKSLNFFGYILIPFFLIGVNIDLSAKHIIGGDVFYECVSLDTVRNRVRLHFEFQMYRDNRCSTNGEDCAYFDGDSRATSPNASPGAEFGVYRKNGDRWIFVTKTSPIRPEIIQKVPPNDPPCLIVPPAIDVERGVYQFDFELDIIESNYLIAYQRCCRSESISNLVNPGDFGAVFSVEITPTALRTCNNSPVFNEFPPLIVCAGFELEYDNGATDVEGDQVIYEFCTPLSSGGPNGAASRTNCNSTPVPEPSACTPDGFRFVSFLSPTFTTTAPMGGNPVVSIDRNTGLLSGTPTIVGEHVMAVCANEYRNGVLLSTIRRDFQFIVSICEKAVNADIASDNSLGKNFEIMACGDFDVQFENRSTRAQDIVAYRWEFDLGNSLLVSTDKDPLITFPALGVYDAKMILNPGIPNCTDSAFVTIKVLPGLEADYTLAYDTCVAGPVDFTDLSKTDGNNIIVSRLWDWDDGNSEDVRTITRPRHLYQAPGTFQVTLTITDNNGCVEESRKELVYAPAPNTIIVEPSRFIGCEPAEVFFNNLTFPINDDYDITWNFGDGSDGDNQFEISPTHIYEEDGIYSVTVDIVSPLGCEVSRTFPNWISVQKGPDAEFSSTPERTTIDMSTVAFSNSTTGAIAYYWEFGDGNISFDVNPTHTYRDTGIQNVILLATSSNGCTDTISKIIDIIPVADITFPNAFTPNGDGRNDEFRGVGSVNLVNDYNLTIYDRWGKIVFKSTDPLEGWNGQLNNTGAMLPLGVYMFRSTWKVPRGEENFAEGPATLVR
jgi:gliding motility-associated-like protein